MKTKLFTVLAIVAAIATAAIYSFQRNQSAQTPDAKFEKTLGEPVSTGCTQLIAGAYNVNQAVNKMEEKISEENTQVKELLQTVGKTEANYLFKDADIDKSIAAEMSKVSDFEDRKALRDLTPALKNILGARNNSFYKNCEDIHLQIFDKCFQEHEEKEKAVACLNEGLQNSTELKALYQSI